MRDIYIGIFYWLFEMSERAPSRWWSEWKAYLALAWLEIFILLSLLFYSGNFFEIPFELTPLSTLPIILLFVIKGYLIFEKDDKWKGYIEEFRAKSKKERRKSLTVTILIILFVLANFIFSIYLMTLWTR